MSTLSSRIFTITDQSKLASSSSTFLFPLFPSHSRSFSRSSRSSILYGRTHVAKPIRASASQLPSAASSVTVENSESESDPSGTLFVIRARNRIGLLQVITGVFKVLGLHVEKATVEFEGDFFVKRFFVTDSHGAKIPDPDSLDRIKKALTDAIEDGGTVSMGPTSPTTRGVMVRRPGSGLGMSLGSDSAKAERMFRLMDGFLKNDSISLQQDILRHVEYTVARSRFNFDDFEAYQALAHSVRDRLIERSHDTQLYFKRKDPKRVYFLSFEYLMGIYVLPSELFYTIYGLWMMLVSVNLKPL